MQTINGGGSGQSFNGRINRITYWLSAVLTGAVKAVFIFTGMKNSVLFDIVLIFICVLRLHDIGLSGWYVLIGVVVEALFFMIGLAAHASAVMNFAMLVIGGLMIWLGCVKSDPDFNKWGAVPEPGLGFSPPR